MKLREMARKKTTPFCIFPFLQDIQLDHKTKKKMHNVDCCYRMQILVDVYACDRSILVWYIPRPHLKTKEGSGHQAYTDVSPRNLDLHPRWSVIRRKSAIGRIRLSVSIAGVERGPNKIFGV